MVVGGGDCSNYPDFNVFRSFVESSPLLIYSGYINLSSYERFISLIFSPTSQNVWSQTHRNISFRITSEIRVLIVVLIRKGIVMISRVWFKVSILFLLDLSFWLFLLEEVGWFSKCQMRKNKMENTFFLKVPVSSWQCRL